MPAIRKTGAYAAPGVAVNRITIRDRLANRWPNIEPKPRRKITSLLPILCERYNRPLHRIGPDANSDFAVDQDDLWVLDQAIDTVWNEQTRLPLFEVSKQHA